jgi:hypothetical protein
MYGVDNLRILPLLRRFNPAEPVVEKICNSLED